MDGGLSESAGLEARVGARELPLAVALARRGHFGARQSWHEHGDRDEEEKQRWTAGSHSRIILTWN